MKGLSRRVCVVLVEPSLPENVGAVARAMDNMGIGELRLVRPCDHLGPAARAVATHSTAILEKAGVYRSLAEAIQDRQVILGASARTRGRVVQVTPVTNLDRLIPVSAKRVALVFGRESTGLSNDELALCNGWIAIPTFGASRSLNLSHAVMVVLYELARPGPCPSPPPTSAAAPAASAEIEALKQRLFEVLARTRFLRTKNRDALWLSFADLLGRARPTARDVRLLHGLLHRILVTLDRGQRGG